MNPTIDCKVSVDPKGNFVFIDAVKIAVTGNEIEEVANAISNFLLQNPVPNPIVPSTYYVLKVVMEEPRMSKLFELRDPNSNSVEESLRSFSAEIVRIPYSGNLSAENSLVRQSVFFCRSDLFYEALAVLLTFITRANGLYFTILCCFNLIN